MSTMRHKVIVSLALVGVAAFGAPFSRADETQTLLSLSAQAFNVLHGVVVTLPNSTQERISRSLQQLPPGWPAGQKKGLVEAQYMDQAFLSTSVAALTSGVVVTFYNEAEGFTTYVVVSYNTQTQQLSLGGFGAHAGRDLSNDFSPLSTNGNPCESEGDNFTCSGSGCPCSTGSPTCNCGHAVCGGADGYEKTGQQDDYGNPIYACVSLRCSHGAEVVGCGSRGFYPIIQVLSPRT